VQFREEVALFFYFFMFKNTPPPSNKLSLVITIPCYDEPDLFSSLKSLYECNPLDDNFQVEVLVVINASETSSKEIKDRNKETYLEALKWKENHDTEVITFYFHLDNEFPKKHAGVGLARRLAMDFAFERLNQIGNSKGVIACFDADSKCDANYLKEIHQHFNKNEKTPGCSIYFEHPISGNEYAKEIYRAIENYETHLRYYNLAVRYTGYPGAYHTVGSSMAVRAEAYNKQGGMNKRKAGEDFYFLDKIISLGNFTELNTTRVIPSPRPSDRVPFGTGRAVSEILNSVNEDYKTYAFQSFQDLKIFFDQLPLLYSEDYNYTNFPSSIKSFISKEQLEKKILEIHKNSSNYNSFVKRFFSWFNAFKILKFTHHNRDTFAPNNKINKEVNKLLKLLLVENTKNKSIILLRNIERNS